MRLTTLSLNSFILLGSFSLLVNTSSVLFCSFIVFFNSVTSFSYFCVFFYYFVEVLSVFISSSPTFSEHLYSHYFNFIRQTAYLILLKFFPEILFCSFVWNIIACGLILPNLLSYFYIFDRLVLFLDLREMIFCRKCPKCPSSALPPGHQSSALGVSPLWALGAFC